MAALATVHVDDRGAGYGPCVAAGGQPRRKARHRVGAALRLHADRSRRRAIADTRRRHGTAAAADAQRRALALHYLCDLSSSRRRRDGVSSGTVSRGCRAAATALAAGSPTPTLGLDRAWRGAGSMAESRSASRSSRSPATSALRSVGVRSVADAVTDAGSPYALRDRRSVVLVGATPGTAYAVGTQRRLGRSAARIMPRSPPAYALRRHRADRPHRSCCVHASTLATRRAGRSACGAAACTCARHGVIGRPAIAVQAHGRCSGSGRGRRRRIERLDAELRRPARAARGRGSSPPAPSRTPIRTRDRRAVPVADGDPVIGVRD